MRNLNLKVHQRIFTSLIIIAFLLAVYASRSYYSLNLLSKNFNIIVSHTAPLNKVSSNLLSEKMELILLIQSITRQYDLKSLLTQVKSINITTDNIKILLEQLQKFGDHFQEIPKHLLIIDTSFKQLLKQSDILTNLQQDLIVKKEALPHMLGELRHNLEKIKSNILLITEESDIEISTETYLTVTATEKINNLINNLYLNPDLKAMQKDADLILEHYEQLASTLTTLEAMDEFDSEEWDLAYEGFETTQFHIKDPSGLLNNVLLISKLEQDLFQSLAQTDDHADFLIEKIKKLNLLTQVALENTNADVSKILSSSQTISVLIGFITILATVLIGKWLHASIQRPLNQFQNYVASIEEGDLTQTISIKSGDEFEETADQLVGVTDRLSHVMQEISYQVDQVESTSNFITTSSQDLKSVLKQQTQEVNEVNDLILNLESASENVRNNITLTHDRIDEVSNWASTAASEANQSIKIVHDLKNYLTESLSSVEVLVSLIQKIHGITDLISNIADQINLLALNAAIEAARAGSHGRGFAVVADEVRSLAANTQESTQVIHQQIEQIIEHSMKSKQSVDQSHSIAETAMERFKQTGAVMEKIDNATSEVSKLALEVNTAAENQTQFTKAGVRKLKDIKQISQLNASTFQSISMMMVKLTDLSESLTREVNFFEYHGKNLKK